MVAPESPVDLQQIEGFLNGLVSVTFEYKNGSLFTMRGDALAGWVGSYRMLVQLADNILKAAREKQAAPTSPTTLADELKKRGS